MKIKPQKANSPRTYTTVRGAVVPSVTEVIAVADRRDFSAWRNRVGKLEANRITTNAKQLGTKVHSTAQAVAQAFTRDTEIYVLEEMQPYADAVRGFLDEHVDEVVQTELALSSDRLGFGGTLDAYVRLKDQSYAVVDYKVVSQLSRDHGLQLCAYALLLREHGYAINKRLGVRLWKDQPGRWSVREYSNHLEDLEGWRGALSLWYWQQARRIERDMKNREAVE